MMQGVDVYGIVKTFGEVLPMWPLYRVEHLFTFILYAYNLVTWHLFTRTHYSRISNLLVSDSLLEVRM